MNLFVSPFYKLGISTRASKQKIVEACDEKSLSLDPELCARWRTQLTQPRSRIAYELTWLPGVSPSRSLSLLKLIQDRSSDIIKQCDGLDPIVKCNVLSSYLSYNKPSDSSHLLNILTTISEAFDQINPNNIVKAINEDRQLSQLPLIQDIDNIKDDLEEHRKYLAGVMKDALNNVKSPDIIMTRLVEKVTSNGQKQPLQLICDLTDLYQIEVKKYLDQLSDQINILTSRIQSDHEFEFEQDFTLLNKKVRLWDQIAQPIQLIAAAKGLDDEYSKKIATDIRNTALHLANEKDMHHAAQKITTLLGDIFKELPQFADKISADISALDGIIENKKKRKEDYAKWREEVSLDIKIGTVMSDRLILSPEAINFNGHIINTNKVTAVRWGVLVHYTNRSEDKSFYTAWVGDNHQTMEIECNTTFETKSAVKNRYELVTNKLWKLVGVRLLEDTLQRLSSGEKIEYGNLLVDSNGILFQYEKVYAEWEDLSISNQPGAFVISTGKVKATSEALSYRDLDNVVILEPIMRFLWKDGNYQKLKRGEFK